jgi:hypothetical protein
MTRKQKFAIKLVYSSNFLASNSICGELQLINSIQAQPKADQNPEYEYQDDDDYINGKDGISTPHIMCVKVENNGYLTMNYYVHESGTACED